MKLRVASDLHYEHTYKAQHRTRHARDPYPEFWVPPEMPDDKDTVLVLAGDLYNGLKSIPIIKTFHERFKFVIIVLGNHDCVSEDTELLTKRGFINYTDIRKDDMVLTMNPDKTTVWQNINNIIVKHYDGDVVNFESEKFEFCVTPNHRVMNVKSKFGEIRYSLAKELSNRLYVPVSGNSLNVGVDIDANMLELIGIILTDGGIQGNSIQIYQSKLENIERIDFLLRTLNIEYTKKTRIRNVTEICGKALKSPPNPTTEYYIKVASARKILDYGISKSKFPDWFSELSMEQFESLLNGIILGDGTRGKNYTSATIYKDKRFLEDLQILCVQFGYNALLKKYRERDYKLYITKRNFLQYDGLSHIKPTPYKGVVWCLEVDNTNFLVRKNGKCHFTGNCYNQNIHTLNQEYKDELVSQEMDNVHLLDRDVVKIDDIVFIGATLWTDMNKEDPYTMMVAPNYMTPDFGLIHEGETTSDEYITRKKKLQVATWLDKNEKHFGFIKKLTEVNSGEKVCIVTHHGCTFKAVDEKFEHELVGNGFFFSEYGDYIADHPNIRAWIHGHTHSPVDLMIGETRVVANPFGYPSEKTMFNEYFTIEI